MKLGVIIKSTRADETLTLVKALLQRASTSNEIVLKIECQQPSLIPVVARYLPPDNRIAEFIPSDCNFLFRVNDSDMTIVPENWDTVEEIASQFVPFESTPDRVDLGTFTGNSIDDVASQVQDAAIKHFESNIAPVPQQTQTEIQQAYDAAPDIAQTNSEEEETGYEIVSTTVIPGSEDVLAVLRKKSNG
jgi:hypothetical protein